MDWPSETGQTTCANWGTSEDGEFPLEEEMTQQIPTTQELIHKVRSCKTLNLSRRYISICQLKLLRSSLQNPDACIRSICLSRCGIGGSIDHLRAVDNIIQAASGLLHLDLAENRINEVGAEIIAESVARHRSLETVILDGIVLVKALRVQTRAALHDRNYTDTDLIVIARIIKYSRQLEHVSLQGNRFTSTAIIRFATDVCESNLITVQVGEAVLSVGSLLLADKIESLVLGDEHSQLFALTVLQHNPHLISVKMFECKGDEEEEKNSKELDHAFSSFFQKSNLLNQFTLNDKTLYRRNVLSSSPSWSSLALPSSTCSSLLRWLQRRCSRPRTIATTAATNTITASPKEFNFNFNFNFNFSAPAMGVWRTRQFMAVTAWMTQDKIHVESINLSNQRALSSVITTLVEFLKSSTTLTRLNITQCGLCTEDVVQITEAIKVKRKLRYLQLGSRELYLWPFDNDNNGASESSRAAAAAAVAAASPLPRQQHVYVHQDPPLTIVDLSSGIRNYGVMGKLSMILAVAKRVRNPLLLVVMLLMLAVLEMMMLVIVFMGVLVDVRGFDRLPVVLLAMVVLVVFIAFALDVFSNPASLHQHVQQVQQQWRRTLQQQWSIVRRTHRLRCSDHCCGRRHTDWFRLSSSDNNNAPTLEDPSRCYYDDYDAIVIAELIRADRSMEELDLSGNSFSPSAIAGLLKAIKDHPGLTSLTLESNGLSYINLDDGVNALVDCLRANQRIIQVKFFQDITNSPKVLEQIVLNYDRIDGIAYSSSSLPPPPPSLPPASQSFTSSSLSTLLPVPTSAAALPLPSPSPCSSSSLSSSSSVSSCTPAPVVPAPVPVPVPVPVPIPVFLADSHSHLPASEEVKWVTSEDGRTSLSFDFNEPAPHTPSSPLSSSIMCTVAPAADQSIIPGSNTCQKDAVDERKYDSHFMHEAKREPNDKDSGIPSRTSTSTPTPPSPSDDYVMVEDDFDLLEDESFATGAPK